MRVDMDPPLEGTYADDNFFSIEFLGRPLFTPCWELYAYIKNSLVHPNAYFDQFKLLLVILYLQRY